MKRLGLLLTLIVCSLSNDELPTQLIERCGAASPASFQDCITHTQGKFRCCFVDAKLLGEKVAGEVSAKFSEGAFADTKNYCVFRFDYDYDAMYQSSELSSGLKSWQSRADEAINCKATFIGLAVLSAFLAFI